MQNFTGILMNVLRGGFLTCCFVVLSLTGWRVSAVGAQSTIPGASEGLWMDVDEVGLRLDGEWWIQPEHYRTLAVDLDNLDSILASAPMESSVQADQEQSLISLPIPDGRYEWFHFVEAPIMAPELAESYPQIKTYLGWGVDDPTASVRFDRTQAGFHAMILSGNGTV